MLADNTFAMSAPTMTGVHAAEFDVRYGALLNSTIDWTPHGTWLDHRVVARPPRKHRASGLHAANAHHRAYVGPKNRYGDMAASMFSLLYFSGLRETSKLLDVGCGSLRLGRIAIPFLQRGNYHCIEPSLVALRAGLQHELGTDLLRLKWPSFAINSAFEPPANADAVRSYDYLIAQSVLSHAAEDLLELALRQLHGKMSSSSVLLATFVVHTAGESAAKNRRDADAERGWVYPECVSNERSRLAALVARQQLREVELSWPHHSQKWFALCRIESASCARLEAALPTLRREPWQMKALIRGKDRTKTR